MARTDRPETATPASTPDPATPPAKEADEIRFFEGTVAKIKTLEDGTKVEVMSDHVGPGEQLKSEIEDEKEKARAEAAKNANK